VEIEAVAQFVAGLFAADVFGGGAGIFGNPGEAVGAFGGWGVRQKRFRGVSRSAFVEVVDFLNTTTKIANAKRTR